MDIQIKRVYEPAAPQDGFRVLVDRLWPRGMTREQVAAELWLKEIAPSSELRKWYTHDPEKREEFKHRYFVELDAQPQAVQVLLDHIAQGRVTLLFSSKETQYNNAQALREYLLKHNCS
jgi:uncharacterized protein YeaO (DUF488 family)